MTDFEQIILAVLLIAYSAVIYYAGKGDFLNLFAKMILEKIEELSKQGKWIEKQIPLEWCEDDVDIVYECSICGINNFGESPYCPNCGAKMKEGA